MTSSSHREESFEQESPIGGSKTGEKARSKELHLNFFCIFFEIQLSFG
jgi:hypothetical protein